MYDLEYDKAFLDDVIASCGSVVTRVEGELTNEVMLQLAAEWASALRTGFFFQQGRMRRIRVGQTRILLHTWSVISSGSMHVG